MERPNPSSDEAMKSGKGISSAPLLWKNEFGPGVVGITQTFCPSAWRLVARKDEVSHHGRLETCTKTFLVLKFGDEDLSTL